MSVGAVEAARIVPGALEGTAGVVGAAGMFLDQHAPDSHRAGGVA